MCSHCPKGGLTRADCVTGAHEPLRGRGPPQVGAEEPSDQVPAPLQGDVPRRGSPREERPDMPIVLHGLLPGPNVRALP